MQIPSPTFFNPINIFHILNVQPHPIISLHRLGNYFSIINDFPVSQLFASRTGFIKLIYSQALPYLRLIMLSLSGIFLLLRQINSLSLVLFMLVID